MSDLESDLFSITLADEDDPEAGASATAAAPPADRTGQTEEEFQAVRRGYRVNVENGDVSFLFCLCFLFSLSPRPR